jgi:hypothetical protein
MRKVKERYIQLCVPDSIDFEELEKHIRIHLDKTYNSSRYDEEIKKFVLETFLDYHFDYTCTAIPVYGLGGSMMMNVSVAAWVEVPGEEEDNNGHLGYH